MKIAASIFKTLFLCLCIIANTHLAYAQTASILPQGKTQFLDNNGKPLTSGTVDFYIPSTTTRKTTWQNSAETVANSNPVVLDAGGRAIIYGDGSYRQVVKDRLGNVIWDQVTSSTGSGSGGSTATGDGDLVGTIKPWAGMTAPNQYVFTYGQEISRTTYSALFTAITSSQSVFCTSGSPTLTGLSDTTNFWVGASVEVSCLAAGFSTIISKTSSSITLASNANVSTNVTAIIFPWGRGNGTTTFNVPDLRGFAIAGNNNMGGVASSQLNTTYFGATDPNSVGAAGGSQSKVLLTANLPAYTPAGTNTAITSTQTNVIQGAAATASVQGGGNVLNIFNGAPTSATVTAVAPTFTGTAQGGLSTAFSLIQPTRTTNYIIKTTPDSNSATASGVTSLGGMTGDIACGAGLLCTGNTISSTTGTAIPYSVLSNSAAVTAAPAFNSTPNLKGLALLPDVNTFTPSLSVAQTISGTYSGQFDLNKLQVLDSADNGASEGRGLMLEYDFGGSTLKGARGAIYSYLNHQSPTSSTNPNRNYTSGVFVAQAATDDTGTGGSKRGALFALNPNVKLINAAATNWLEISGGEVNTQIVAGASVSYKNAWSLVQFGSDAVQGIDYDVALSISNQTGAVGWNDGILFGPQNGQFPIKSNGNILRTIGGTVNNGIDISNSTVTTSAFKSNGFSVDGSGNVASTGFVSGSTFRIGSVTFAQAIAGPFHQINDASGNASLFLGDNANVSRATDFQFLSKDGTVTFGDWSTSGLRLGAVGSKLGAALFSGSTSGTVTLQPPAAAGASTLTLPAATDTLVGQSTTDTLSNKTIASAAFSGTQTGAFTTTGNIQISKTSPDLILNKSAEAGQNIIEGRTAGLNRWTFLFGSATVSDWSLLRYDDTGAFIATAMSISRSTGDAQIGSTTDATSTSAASFYTFGGLGVAKKLYVGTDINAVGGNLVMGTASKTLTLKQGSNGTVGTFVCTGGGTITINNTNIAITDAIIISLNTVGGTITTPPATKAITAATSFQALCGATDTSTYNYAIIKNAA